jgi:hypothetical protein
VVAIRRGVVLLDLEEFRSERREDDSDRLLRGIARGVVRVPATPYLDAGAIALGRFETGSARLVKGGQDGSCCVFIICHAGCTAGATVRSPVQIKSRRRCAKRWRPRKTSGANRRGKHRGDRAVRLIPSRDLAPGEGFEPPAKRLTAACSTTELPGISDRGAVENPARRWRGALIAELLSGHISFRERRGEDVTYVEQLEG